MKNTRTADAFKLYYENVLKEQHNNPALLETWGSDPGSYETQVMCRAMGNKIPDTQKYECDGEEFGPMRWPYDAGGEPHWSNPPIKFVISSRVKAIGWTGWNWKDKKSVALGYDFDSLVDHGSGISPEQMKKLDEIDIPWLEIIKSTRGNGRHIYIRFQDPFPVTQNHHEHAALARAFLPLISKHTGFDVKSDMDVCGQVLWFHHIDASDDGYTFIRPATQILTAEFVPPNWRDHLDVVSGGRSKVKVKGWTPDGKQTEGDELDEMTQANPNVPLDEVHLKILEDLEGTGHTSLWVHDHHLWQGHTGGLKTVFDDWADRGIPMKGLFDSNTLDSDPGKPNCFMRPKPNGAWDVYRFGDGVEECPLWSQRGKWTHTTFNYPSTLKQICLASGGFEGTEEKQGYMFDSEEELRAALDLLGSKLVLPDRAADRALSLHARDDKVVLVIEKKRNDDKRDFPRYVKTPRGWEIWIKDAGATSDKEVEEESMWTDLDKKVRALKMENVSGVAFDSWVIKDETEKWVTHPRENVRSYLASLGYAKPEPIFGGAVYKSWMLVNEPFQAEYPGGRVWNRDAAQFVYAPIVLKEGEKLSHPTWTRIMNHCGVELNEYIPEIPWCKKWGIVNGGDYLTAWVACMFQNPWCKLPYLFMYGPQNCGKSSFHEALELLLTNGVQKADRALTSEQGYNGELMDAVLAVIDEVDIAKAGSSVYNKLKEWVTGLRISIHAKYKPVQDVRSCLHFVQMSNSRSSLPVFPGDTRITAMAVPTLEEEIPREELQDLLRAEAPHFMRTLMDWDIPPAIGRLALPIIETQGKIDAADNNENELSQFIQENCCEISGAAIKLSDFRSQFVATLEDYQRKDWSPKVVKSYMSERYPVGKGGKTNQTIIGNLSFEEVKPSMPYIKQGGRLVKEDENE